MGFVIKINGVPVREIEGQRVNRISLNTAKGEVGMTRIEPDQGECNIIVQVADPRQVHLEDVERAQARRNVTPEDEAAAFPQPQENTNGYAGMEYDGTPQTSVDNAPAESTIAGPQPEEPDLSVGALESEADKEKRENADAPESFDASIFATITEGTETGPIGEYPPPPPAPEQEADG